MKKSDFDTWMSEYFDKKTNQLNRSSSTFPKRVEKMVFDLSVAPTQPIKISIPVKSIYVQKIYQTSSISGVLQSKSGTVRVLFDYDNLMNISNAIEIRENDSFSVDTAVANTFITWSAQTNTSAVIYFYNDIDFRAGFGRVLTTPSSPLSINFMQATTAGFPMTYTIPAFYYAKLNIFMNATSVTGICRVDINGSTIFSFGGRLEAINVPAFMVRANTVIDAVVVADGAFISVYIEQYPL